ncbi:prepilin peptidase [Naumannella huperziae]
MFGDAASLPTALGLAVATAAACAAGSRVLPALLLEPAEPDGKRPYAELADAPMVLGCGTAGAIAGGLIGWFLPWPLWPAWLVFATLGLVLIAIDARTTWLPLALTRPLWAATAAAVPVTGALAGWEVAFRMIVAGAAVGAFVLAFWWVGRGALGFGDVRLAPVLGVVTGTLGVGAVLWGLLLGSLIGVAWGLLARLTGRRGAFPYGPALWLGALLAIPLTAS